MSIGTSENSPIRVEFIRSDRFPSLGRLGMTFAPGKKQAYAASGAWDRDLKTDLQRLRSVFGVDVLVSLVEDHELVSLQIEDLVAKCNSVGIEIIRFPIPDTDVPGGDNIDVVRRAARALRAGKTVVTHCKGGQGRAGTVAACIAIMATDLELSGSEAIELVRKARSGAVENSKQEEFVRSFPKLIDRGHL